MEKLKFMIEIVNGVKNNFILEDFDIKVTDPFDEHYPDLQIHHKDKCFPKMILKPNYIFSPLNKVS